MFKIEETTIHCSRGESVIMGFKLPYMDLNSYLKYIDGSENVYWYDKDNDILYDSTYTKSDISIETLTQVFYQFQIGDEILFNVYKKNGYGKEPVLSKKIIVDTVADNVDIPLTESDTTFEKSINKATVFWYDISLNNDSTVLGYDEEGAKQFILYPAKGENEV